MVRKRHVSTLAALALACGYAGGAEAALNVFQTYTGSYGLSTDGGGSTGNSYAVSAFVPLGATVTAAYLYQSTYNFSSPQKQPMTLNGNAVTFGPNVVNTSSTCCGLASARADVTGLVASVVNGGAGGTYNFAVGEGNSANTDGAALVVVYSLSSLATQTVALLDGFASVTGDTATVNFTTPLNPTAPGFTADLRLGIGFSCCNQASTVAINGTTITTNAGNDDETGVDANGALITVGGNDDPFSPFLPTYAQDHERYNLAPYIKTGDTKVTIQTSNSSQDDNIFFAGLLISGNAVVTSGVPEPASWALMIGGFGAIGVGARRRKAAQPRPA